MGELSKVPNIGKTVEEQLIQVGIDSVDELKKVGAKAAWLKIQEVNKVVVFIAKKSKTLNLSI